MNQLISDKIKFLAFKSASEAFTTGCVPDNWNEMTEEAQDEWFGFSKWGAMGDRGPSEIYDLIENQSDVNEHAINEAINLVLNNLKKNLVEAAENGLTREQVILMNMEKMLD
jgi:hypothetical protein